MFVLPLPCRAKARDLAKWLLIKTFPGNDFIHWVFCLNSGRYKRLHAALFLLKILHLSVVHLDLIFLSKGTSPEEEGVVPLLADPTTLIFVSFYV